MQQGVQALAQGVLLDGQAQIDAHPLFGQGEGNDIIARIVRGKRTGQVAVEHVVTRTAAEQVVAGTADEGIVAGLAAKDVVPFSPLYGVVAFAAHDQVDVGVSHQKIVMGRPEEVLDEHQGVAERFTGKVQAAAEVHRDPCGRGAVGNRIGSVDGLRVLLVGSGRHEAFVMTVQQVASGSAVEQVIPAAAHQGIVAPAAHEDIVAGQTQQAIGTRTALDEVVVCIPFQEIVVNRPGKALHVHKGVIADRSRLGPDPSGVRGQAGGDGRFGVLVGNDIQTVLTLNQVDPGAGPENVVAGPAL